jgi:uncharacterized protein (TIRG00374 family)
MSPQKKPAARHALIFLIKSAVAALLLFLLLRKTRYQDFAESLRGVVWWWLAAAATLHIVGYIISAHRWRILLLAQGLRPSLCQLIKSYVIATFFNTILLGTVGGDIYRAYDSGVKNKKGAEAVSAVFIERLTGVAAIMILAAVGMLFLLTGPTRLSASAFWSVGAGIGICAVVFLGLVAVLLVLLHPRTAKRIAAILDRPAPLFGKLRKIVLSLHSAVTVYRSNRRPIYKNLLWAGALQLNVIAHWLLIGLAMGSLLHLRTNPLYYLYSYMIIVPALTLVLMIPVTPGGFGVREWTVWAFRTPLGFAAGAGRDTAALMGWLQVATVLFFGVIGFLMFLFRLFSVRRSRAQQVVPGEAVPPEG